MASSAAAARSTHPRWRQIRAPAGFARVETWLDAERDQLPLWLAVALGGGVSLWFVLPDAAAWRIAGLTLTGVALAALAMGRGGRLARAVAIVTLAAAIGLALIWARADRLAAPVLAGPAIATFTARVERVEPLVARGLVRMTLVPMPGATGAGAGGGGVALPRRFRVNLAQTDAPAGLDAGSVISLRARLMPPAGPAVPGAYDFARAAWFDGLGATGRGFAPVTIRSAGPRNDDLRDTLSRHITDRIAGSAGGIAAALAMGDVGGIAEDDSEAMRRAGLAHLLSVSGLHITAAVGLAMFVVLRLLALSPWLALRVRLPLVAGAAGAAVAIGYTLLTGSQVPTIRSCVAALLVLAALAMGREAVTLRLVAAGAIVVLLVWPESLAGPSFQLSFAAITAIVALHEHPRVSALFGPHDEGRGRRLLRETASLLLTGIVVELALMPIAVFHFHKAGLYGAFANIVAIPWTTFVVMPLEALALLLDTLGLGAPLWWLTERSLWALLWLARSVATAPGAIAALPAMPSGAYALMVLGGLWIALWRTRWRRIGAIPLAAGALWALATPAPDLIVTGDGRHAALRLPDGSLALLRDRAGDYTKDMLAENGGVDGEPLLLEDQPQARCSRDLCVATMTSRGRWLWDVGTRTWRIVATRSAYMVPATELIAACRSADIVISERILPRRCKPRWLKLDRRTLAKFGGVALTLAMGRIETVRHPGDHHPWRDPPLLPRTPIRSGGADRTAYPARGPGQGHNAGDHRHDWRDRAGPSRLRDGNI